MEPSIINSGMHAPAPPMMRARTVPNTYAFSYKSGAYRDHRFGPEGQTRTKEAK